MGMIVPASYNAWFSQKPRIWPRCFRCVLRDTCYVHIVVFVWELPKHVEINTKTMKSETQQQRSRDLHATRQSA